MTPVVDVLVLDRHMPDLSGDELLATLEELDCDPAGVVVGAYAAASLLHRETVAHYIEKPVTASSLVAAVEGALAPRQSTQPAE